MALTSANKAITSALKTLEPHSICHDGNNISQSQKWPLTSATTNKHIITQVAVPSAALGKNISLFKCGNSIHHYSTTSANHIVVITSATVNKTSFIVVSIFHKQKIRKWNLLHCHNGNKHQP